MVEESRRPAHVAGIRKKQSECLYGCSGVLRPRDGNLCRTRGAGVLLELLAARAVSGYLELTQNEQAPARSRHIVDGRPLSMQTGGGVGFGWWDRRREARRYFNPRELDHVQVQRGFDLQQSPGQHAP